MTSTPVIARRLFLFGFVAALLTAFGCSSGGDGGGTTTPALLCGDASPAASPTIGFPGASGLAVSYQ